MFSRKVRANKSLDFTIYENLAENINISNSRFRKGISIPHSIIKQPREAVPKILLLKLIIILSRNA
jgi:hypothetical protein